MPNTPSGSPSSLFGQSGSKGASQAENQIGNSQVNFMGDLQKDFGTTFANQQNILQSLAKAATSIVNAGPSQFGFSAPELTADNTLATTSNAVATRNAMTIAGEQSANTGASNLPAGANGARADQIAVQQQQDLSNKLLGIQEAGYSAGRQNYQNAEGTLTNVAGMENPQGYAGAANTAGENAFNTANTIQKQNQAANPWPQVGGLVGSLAGTALSMIPGGQIPGALLSGLGKQVSQSNQNFQNSYQPQSIPSGTDYSIPYQPIQTLDLDSSLYPSSYNSSVGDSG